MKISPGYKLSLRAQNAVFVVLLVAIAGVIGYLTTRYVWAADWTATGDNSLSAPTRKLLKTLDGPVTITAFVRDNPSLRNAIRTFISRYQRADEHISLQFVNPDTHPQRARDLGIVAKVELYVQYDGRGATVTNVTEEGLTNALLSIAKTSGSKIVFVTGHGERDPSSRANYDLGRFGKALEKIGFKLAKINLAQEPEIPAGTAVLAIAGPQLDYLPGEVKLIEKYVAQGGNLLWLADPGSRHGLKPLEQALNIRLMNGIIVDATSARLGLRQIGWLVLGQYPSGPVTKHFATNTLIPKATAVAIESHKQWRTKPFLKSRPLPVSWLETGELAGEVTYDKKAGDKPGPLNIGVTLARPLAALNLGAKEGDQRIVVVGDGDFLANAYLGNGGNLRLGLNIINWLSQNDQYIGIDPPSAKDAHLALSPTGKILLGLGFLIALPLLLLICGGTVWFRRRRA